MKNLNSIKYLSIAACFLVVLASCIKKDIPFSFSISGIVFTVPAQPGDGKWKTFMTRPILTGIKTKIVDAGGDPANLKSIKLKSMNVTNTSGQNFDKIDYFEAYISTNSTDSVKVAYKSPIPKTGLTSIDLDNTYADLSNYVKQDSFTLSLRGYNSDDLPVSTYNAKVTFDVVVGPKK